MCNLSTDFLQTCRGSTNLAIHRRLAKFIDNSRGWLELSFSSCWLIFFYFKYANLSFSQGFSMVGDALMHFARVEYTSQEWVHIECTFKLKFRRMIVNFEFNHK